VVTIDDEVADILEALNRGEYEQGDALLDAKYPTNEYPSALSHLVVGAIHNFIFKTVSTGVNLDRLKVNLEQMQYFAGKLGEDYGEVLDVCLRQTVVNGFLGRTRYHLDKGNESALPHAITYTNALLTSTGARPSDDQTPSELQPLLQADPMVVRMQAEQAVYGSLSGVFKQAIDMEKGKDAEIDPEKARQTLDNIATFNSLFSPIREAGIVQPYSEVPSTTKRLLDIYDETRGHVSLLFGMCGTQTPNAAQVGMYFSEKRIDGLARIRGELQKARTDNETYELTKMDLIGYIPKDGFDSYKRDVLDFIVENAKESLTQNDHDALQRDVKFLKEYAIMMECTERGAYDRVCQVAYCDFLDAMGLVSGDHEVDQEKAILALRTIREIGPMVDPSYCAGSTFRLMSVLGQHTRNFKVGYKIDGGKNQDAIENVVEYFADRNIPGAEDLLQELRAD
jgi:hypothetical protein